MKFVWTTERNRSDLWQFAKSKQKVQTKTAQPAGQESPQSSQQVSDSAGQSTDKVSVSRTDMAPADFYDMCLLGLADFMEQVLPSFPSFDEVVKETIDGLNSNKNALLSNSSSSPLTFLRAVIRLQSGEESGRVASELAQNGQAGYFYYPLSVKYGLDVYENIEPLRMHQLVASTDIFCQGFHALTHLALLHGLSGQAINLFSDESFKLLDDPKILVDKDSFLHLVKRAGGSDTLISSLRDKSDTDLNSLLEELIKSIKEVKKPTQAIESKQLFLFTKQFLEGKSVSLENNEYGHSVLSALIAYGALKGLNNLENWMNSSSGQSLNMRVVLPGNVADVILGTATGTVEKYPKSKDIKLSIPSSSGKGNVTYSNPLYSAITQSAASALRSLLLAGLSGKLTSHPVLFTRVLFGDFAPAARTVLDAKNTNPKPYIQLSPYNNVYTISFFQSSLLSHEGWVKHQVPLEANEDSDNPKKLVEAWAKMPYWWYPWMDNQRAVIPSIMEGYHNYTANILNDKTAGNPPPSLGGEIKKYSSASKIREFKTFEVSENDVKNIFNTNSEEFDNFVKNVFEEITKRASAAGTFYLGTHALPKYKTDTSQEADKSELSDLLSGRESLPESIDKRVIPELRSYLDVVVKKLNSVLGKGESIDSYYPVISGLYRLFQDPQHKSIVDDLRFKDKLRLAYHLGKAQVSRIGMTEIMKSFLHGQPFTLDNLADEKVNMSKAVKHTILGDPWLPLTIAANAFMSAQSPVIKHTFHSFIAEQLRKALLKTYGGHLVMLMPVPSEEGLHHIVNDKNSVSPLADLIRESSSQSNYQAVTQSRSGSASSKKPTYNKGQMFKRNDAHMFYTSLPAHATLISSLMPMEILIEDWLHRGTLLEEGERGDSGARDKVFRDLRRSLAQIFNPELHKTVLDSVKNSTSIFTGSNGGQAYGESPIWNNDKVRTAVNSGIHEMVAEFVAHTNNVLGTDSPFADLNPKDTDFIAKFRSTLLKQENKVFLRFFVGHLVSALLGSHITPLLHKAMRKISDEFFQSGLGKKSPLPPLVTVSPITYKDSDGKRIEPGDKYISTWTQLEKFARSAYLDLDQVYKKLNPDKDQSVPSDVAKELWGALSDSVFIGAPSGEKGHYGPIAVHHLLFGTPAALLVAPKVGNFLMNFFSQMAGSTIDTHEGLLSLLKQVGFASQGRFRANYENAVSVFRLHKVMDNWFYPKRDSKDEINDPLDNYYIDAKGNVLKKISANDFQLISRGEAKKLFPRYKAMYEFIKEFAPGLWLSKLPTQQGQGKQYNYAPIQIKEAWNYTKNLLCNVAAVQALDWYIEQLTKLKLQNLHSSTEQNAEDNIAFFHQILTKGYKAADLTDETPREFGNELHSGIQNMFTMSAANIAKADHEKTAAAIQAVNDSVSQVTPKVELPKDRPLIVMPGLGVLSHDYRRSGDNAFVVADFTQFSDYKPSTSAQASSWKPDIDKLKQKLKETAEAQAKEAPMPAAVGEVNPPPDVVQKPKRSRSKSSTVTTEGPLAE